MRFLQHRMSARLIACCLVGGAVHLLSACDVRLPDAPLAPGEDPVPPPPPDPDPVPVPDPGSIVSVEPALPPFAGDGAVMADDPAIWVHPSDASRSLLFLSDKERGIYVFDLQGRQLQHVDFGTALNNIDVRRGCQLGGELVDVVAGNLRDAGKLALLRIDADAAPGNVLSTLCDPTSSGNDLSDDSYGFTLYRRPTDGTLFAFDKSKSSAPVRQWRIDRASGQVRTTLVRELRDVTIGVAEGFVADDLLGFVYLTEEARGIHKYYADPDNPVQTRLAFFGSDDGSVADREGLALYACGSGTGYLVLSSQGNSTFMVYERQGTNRLVRRFRAVGATGSDGLEVSAAPLPGFPDGIAIVHDDPGVRYLVYDWRAIAGTTLAGCVD